MIKEFDEKIFNNPTSEYRGAPFWAWNCKCEKDELKRQIGILKEMGFGGFHMHSRSGMAVEYLSDEFMDLVSFCCEEADKQGMTARIYDDDRWSSGCAGGLVTKNPKYRLKYLLFTNKKIKTVKKSIGNNTGEPYLIASYDIKLNKNGDLEKYSITDGNAENEMWYAYVCTMAPTPFRNRQTDADTMDENTTDEFIKITHERYKECVGEYFNKNVPDIFTDEPYVYPKKHLPDASMLPWTYDFDETFKECYGTSLIPFIPELRWNTADNKKSVMRYRYFNHVCDRFTQAYIKRYNDWCNKNDICMTGHMCGEESLSSQSEVIGENMRAYNNMGMPGIDMLFDRIELAAVKQAQSIVHQNGGSGVMSELYGVTGWDFDFRGHKFQGDWQAALGVTLRVPHLSWVTMKGCGKRDFPASINYQSAWYKKYSYIENHFARINTVLTRGKPIVKVAVINPVESCWLEMGYGDKSSQAVNDMDRQFRELTEYLLYSGIDFDFISEALIPKKYTQTNDKGLRIGNMEYDAVIIPQMLTIRKTTAEMLEQYRMKDGKVIFIGEMPKYVDGIPQDIKDLFDKSINCSNIGQKLLDLLEEEREIKILINGRQAKNKIYSYRKENDKRYLFIANAKKTDNKDVYEKENVEIEIKGNFAVKILDTLSGEIYDAAFKSDGKKTTVYKTMYFSDSLLLCLTECAGKHNCGSTEPENAVPVSDIKTKVKIKRNEPNVAVLDMAQWSYDGINYMPKEELLRIDLLIRKKFNAEPADGNGLQAWAVKEHFTVAETYLKFEVYTTFEAKCSLAYEEASSISVNGENVSIEKDGYFTDKQIYTTKLPKLKKGKNEIIIKTKITNTIGLENYFLLGDFAVKILGTEFVIAPEIDEIPFGSIVNYGLPFYTGELEYSFDAELPENAAIRICHYRGAVLEVKVDGVSKGLIAFAPYILKLDVVPGKHKITIVNYGTRNNAFGCLHNFDRTIVWQGPSAWYSTDDKWSYEYCLREAGILSSPIICSLVTEGENK